MKNPKLLVITLASAFILILVVFLSVQPNKAQAIAANPSAQDAACEFQAVVSEGAAGCPAQANVGGGTTTPPANTTTTPAPAPKETARQALQRYFDACVAENPNFADQVTLQVGSQSNCVQYLKAMRTIVLFNQFNPDTELSKLYAQEDADLTGAFQFVMTNKLNEQNWTTTEGATQKASLVANGYVNQNANGTLGVGLQGGVVTKPVWYWVNVFTYLYLISHP